MIKMLFEIFEWFDNNIDNLSGVSLKLITGRYGHFTWGIMCWKFVSMNLPAYSQRTLSVMGLLSTLHNILAVWSSSTRYGLSGPTVTTGKSEIFLHFSMEWPRWKYILSENKIVKDIFDILSRSRKLVMSEELIFINIPFLTLTKGKSEMFTLFTWYHLGDSARSMFVPTHIK